MFESASYTCYPTFSVVPYGFGPTVTVMTPTQGTGVWNAYGSYGGGAGNNIPVPVPTPAPVIEAEIPDGGVVGVVEGTGFTPAPEFTANDCGCCRTPFSVMPPSGFQAWRPLIERVNAPYSALLGCKNGYGGGCGGGYGYGF